MRQIDLSKYDVGRVIQRDARGPLIVSGLRRKGRLYPGQVLKIDGGIWHVEQVTATGAHVKCLIGSRRGTVHMISKSDVHPHVSKSELARLEIQHGQPADAWRDETRCAKCWPGDDPTEDEGTARGRDPDCPDHQVTPESAAARRISGLVRRPPKEPETEDVIKKVLAHRAKGLSYSQIEKAMGWEAKKGWRPWKIVKEAAASKKPSPVTKTPSQQQPAAKKPRRPPGSKAGSKKKAVARKSKKNPR